MNVVARPAPLVQLFSGSGRPYPPADEAVTDEEAVNAFLNTVRGYYRTNECRWDYRLVYVTPVDYFVGRKMFEGVFYAARIQEAPPQ